MKIWIVEKNGSPFAISKTREEARTIANYYNGFAKGKRKSPYKVVQYTRG